MDFPVTFLIVLKYQNAVLVCVSRQVRMNCCTRGSCSSLKTNKHSEDFISKQILEKYRNHRTIIYFYKAWCWSLFKQNMYILMPYKRGCSFGTTVGFINDNWIFKLLNLWRMTLVPGHQHRKWHAHWFIYFYIQHMHSLVYCFQMERCPSLLTAQHTPFLCAW